MQLDGNVVGHYSPADLGLILSATGNPVLEAFLHFPPNVDEISSDGFVSPTCVGFCDANWGPQFASVPKPGVLFPCSSNQISLLSCTYDWGYSS